MTNCNCVQLIILKSVLKINIEYVMFIESYVTKYLNTEIFLSTLSFYKIEVQKLIFHFHMLQHKDKYLNIRGLSRAMFVLNIPSQIDIIHFSILNDT